MIKKLIITGLLLIAADFAFNEGAYVHATMAQLKRWSAESSDNINHSIFRA